MVDYECVRCLFCETGYETAVARFVDDSPYVRAIFPKTLKRLYKRGTSTDIYAPLLPGYVFVYSDASLRAQDLTRIPHAIRVLRYQPLDDGCLCGRDLLFANWILAHGGTIGILDAVKVGGYVEIVDGLFKELHGKVVQLDKRKQMAKIQLDVVGDIRSIWLSYQCLERTDSTVQHALFPGGGYWHWMTETGS